MADMPDARVDPPEWSVWREAAAQFERWRSGHPEALDELVRLLSPVLWQVVRAYGLRRETAEDTVQTVWLTLVRHRDRVQDPQAIGGWLLITARRAAWRARRAEPLVTYGEEAPDLPDKAQGPEQVVVAGAEAQRVWASMAMLPERCQRLLRVIAFDDRPDYARLARELDMPIGSIGPTRGRCLQKLRAELERN